MALMAKGKRHLLKGECMMRFFISLFFIHSCFGSIRDHYKIAKDEKGSHHSIKNIDFIYIINLDQRPEKFAMCERDFAPFGIVPYRFSAVNGWELTTEELDAVGLKFLPGMTPLMATVYREEARGQPSYEMMTEYGQTYFCHHMAKGSIGCVLSHLSVLQDAWEAGYETIWVMEDDVEILQDPHVLGDLIERLDDLVDDWDVLFTDRDYRLEKGEYAKAYGAAKRPDMDCSLLERFSPKYTMDLPLGDDFRRISARFGTHSMILRRSGIRKLLDFAEEHKVFLACDLDNYFTVNRYGLCYDVVTNRLDAITDNAKPQYEL
jgi:GR25 family glycosyltransferase involved in LPS biosynthesis